MTYSETSLWNNYDLELFVAADGRLAEADRRLSNSQWCKTNIFIITVMDDCCEIVMKKKRNYAPLWKT